MAHGIHGFSPGRGGQYAADHVRDCAAEAFGQAAGAKIEQNLGFLTFAVALGTVFLLGHWLREDQAPVAAAAAPFVKSPPVGPAKTAEGESTV